VSVGTAAVSNTVEATPTPNASQDGVYRATLGLDIYGRGPTFTVSPTLADDQWFIEQVALVGVPSLAGVDDA
jgi:hypothetical protein